MSLLLIKLLENAVVPLEILREIEIMFESDEPKKDVAFFDYDTCSSMSNIF